MNSCWAKFGNSDHSGTYCDVSFWPNSQLIFVTVTIVKCLTKLYKAKLLSDFESQNGGGGTLFQFVFYEDILARA